MHSQKPAALRSLCGNSRSRRWGVILAGGDGTRLLPLTRKISGDDRPKQFCALTGGETLLDQTRQRVSGMIADWQTLFLLTQTHQRFYAVNWPVWPMSACWSNRITTGRLRQSRTA